MCKYTYGTTCRLLHLSQTHNTFPHHKFTHAFTLHIYPSIMLILYCAQYAIYSIHLYAYMPFSSCLTNMSTLPDKYVFMYDITLMLPTKYIHNFHKFSLYLHNMSAVSCKLCVFELEVYCVNGTIVVIPAEKC